MHVVSCMCQQEMVKSNFVGPDEIMILCSISLIAVKLMLHLHLDISGVLQNVLNAARLHQSHNCTSAQEIRLRLIFFSPFRKKVGECATCCLY